MVYPGLNVSRQQDRRSRGGTELRYLMVLAALAVGACNAKKDPQKVGSALDEARAAIVARNFGQAEELASEAVNADPDNPATHYELARAEALEGNEAKALAELRLAIDKGLANAPRALDDPAFDSIRTGQAFAELQERSAPRREPTRQAEADGRRREPAVQISSDGGHETVRAGDVVINDDDF